MLSPNVLQAESEGAILVRAPEIGTIAASGSERQSWLNGLVTSNLADLSPGRASYGLILVKVGASSRMLVGARRGRGCSWGCREIGSRCFQSISKSTS